VRYTWHRLGHLDWDTIGRWQERGFDFASHTASHPRLTWLSDGHAAAELERSRETLRHRLGPQAARAVAYPFGARDERIERLARRAGYELGFGVCAATGHRSTWRACRFTCGTWGGYRSDSGRTGWAGWVEPLHTRLVGARSDELDAES